MSPATWPRDEPLRERLLVIDRARESISDSLVVDLPRYLARDLVVVNDASTIPASLAGTAASQGVELRLVSQKSESTWTAVLFGEGDWRTRTERRPAPPELARGARIVLAPRLTARVDEVSRISPRLLEITFDRSGDELWSEIYRHGRPIQYAHVARPLELWHVQTPYAGRPWAVELPSAGRPLTAELLRACQRDGIELQSLTHAAGLSSTGDPRIDALLPFAERFHIPEATVAAVARAKARGARVIAVGTTVVRALEGCAASNGGALVAGDGVTDLHIDEGFRPRIVSGLLTGLHEPGASHFSLLQAFAPRALLARAYAHAEREGYLNHEFGDSNLVM